MAKRWGIERRTLFEYALLGVTQVKDTTFEKMVNAKNAADINTYSRQYIQVMKDFDAVSELLKATEENKEATKKEGRNS